MNKYIAHICDGKRLRKKMEENRVDLILASSRRNVAYLTGYQTEHWTWEHAILHMMEKEYDGQDYFIFAGFPLEAGKGTFLIDYAHREDAIRKSGVCVKDFYGYWRKGRIPNINGPGICLEQNYSRTVEETAAQAIMDRGLQEAAVGVEMSRIPSTVLHRFQKLLPKARFVDAFELLFDVRQIKTTEEVRRLRQAYQIATEVYKEVFEKLRVGISPRDILRCEMDGIYKRGGTFSFAHIFFGQGDIDLAYTPPSDRKIRPGDIGVLDIGVVYEGYGTDFARMVRVKPGGDKLSEVYPTFIKTRKAVEKALVPGAKASDVFMAGARCLEADGLCASISNVGHGIGLGCHEKPFLDPCSKDIIAVGQTVVIEIYCEVREVGPVLLEDGGVVTTEGWQSFTDLALDIVEVNSNSAGPGTIAGDS